LVIGALGHGSLEIFLTLAGFVFVRPNRPRIFHEYSNGWRNIRAHWHRTPVQVFVVVFVEGLWSHGAAGDDSRLGAQSTICLPPYLPWIFWSTISLKSASICSQEVG